jgi:hypothetical protein
VGTEATVATVETKVIVWKQHYFLLQSYHLISLAPGTAIHCKWSVLFLSLYLKLRSACSMTLWLLWLLLVLFLHFSTQFLQDTYQFHSQCHQVIVEHVSRIVFFLFYLWSSILFHHSILVGHKRILSCSLCIFNTSFYKTYFLLLLLLLHTILMG